MIKYNVVAHLWICCLQHLLGKFRVRRANEGELGVLNAVAIGMAEPAFAVFNCWQIKRLL